MLLCISVVCFIMVVGDSLYCHQVKFRVDSPTNPRLVVWGLVRHLYSSIALRAGAFHNSSLQIPINPYLCPTGVDIDRYITSLNHSQDMSANFCKNVFVFFSFSSSFFTLGKIIITHVCMLLSH